MASLESRLAPLAEAAAASQGLVLVSARMTGGGKYQTLQVLLERPDGSSPVLDECTAVSKVLARDLDNADLTNPIIKGRYTLEVGSPGLDRPLITLADYQRFTGKTANLRFTHLQNSGYNSFQSATGVIVEADATGVTLQMDTAETPHRFAFTDIHTAKLAPTKAEIDAWMKAAMKRPTNSDND